MNKKHGIKATCRPNILFIMADQFRQDALGSIGGWTKTPNLDRIADEGINFTNCITTSPICMPARVSLATGLYPHNTGLWDNSTSFFLGKEAKTWMQVIQSMGYRTSVFGKTHLYAHFVEDIRDYEDYINAYGIEEIDEIVGPRACVRCKSNMTDRWDEKGFLGKYKEDLKDRYSSNPFKAKPSVIPYEEYADVYVGQQAKKYLQGYDREEPWFCWVSFGGPHEPWDAPEPYHSMYEPESMPNPIPPTGKIFTENRAKGLLDEKRDKIPKVPLADIKKMRANYAGNVTLIDEQIGEILEVIEKKNELDNTIIVFTSDHGEMNGDYGIFYKQVFMESALKIPLIVRTPETLKNEIRGSISKGMVELMDIGVTLVGLAGGNINWNVDARSFHNLLKRPKDTHRTELLAEFRDEIMYMNSEWKLVLNGNGEPYLLFNIEKDPSESTNLAGLPEVKEIERDLQVEILKKISKSLINNAKGGGENFE